MKAIYSHAPVIGIELCTYQSGGESFLIRIGDQTEGGKALSLPIEESAEFVRQLVLAMSDLGFELDRDQVKDDGAPFGRESAQMEIVELRVEVIDVQGAGFGANNAPGIAVRFRPIRAAGAENKDILIVWWPEQIGCHILSWIRALVSKGYELDELTGGVRPDEQAQWGRAVDQDQWGQQWKPT